MAETKPFGIGLFVKGREELLKFMTLGLECKLCATLNRLSPILGSIHNANLRMEMYKV